MILRRGKSFFRVPLSISVEIINTFILFIVKFCLKWEQYFTVETSYVPSICVPSIEEVYRFGIGHYWFCLINALKRCKLIA